MVHRAWAYVRFARRGARRLYASETTVTHGGVCHAPNLAGTRTSANLKARPPRCLLAATFVRKSESPRPLTRASERRSQRARALAIQECRAPGRPRVTQQPRSTTTRPTGIWSTIKETTTGTTTMMRAVRRRRATRAPITTPLVRSAPRGALASRRLRAPPRLRPPIQFLRTRTASP